MRRTALQLLHQLNIITQMLMVLVSFDGWTHDALAVRRRPLVTFLRTRANLQQLTSTSNISCRLMPAMRAQHTYQFGRILAPYTAANFAGRRRRRRMSSLPGAIRSTSIAHAGRFVHGGGSLTRRHARRLWLTATADAALRRQILLRAAAAAIQKRRRLQD